VRLRHVVCVVVLDLLDLGQRFQFDLATRKEVDEHLTSSRAE
jgi:hypothetical protein